MTHRLLKATSPLSLIFVLANLCAYTSSQAAEVDLPPITKAEAQAHADEHIDEWKLLAGDERPRLFYTPEEWKELPQRYQESEGRQRELFDMTIEFARDLAAKKPAPEYKPPEAYVSKKLALMSAQAELWQRPIGDRMSVLALAYHLTGDEKIAERLRDYVLTACSYPNWGLRSKGMHLASSHLARGIAIAYDWVPELFSEEEKETIRKAITYHVTDIEEGLYGKAFWAVSLSNNHNHVSVAALGICGVAFLNEIPQAPAWAGGTMLDMERVVKYNNSDGSTPESASYWNYSFRSITQFTGATKNILDVDKLFDSDFMRNAINYRLYSGTPDFQGLLPWGAVGSWPQPPAVMYFLADHYDNPNGQFLGDHTEVTAWGVGFSAVAYNPDIPSEPPTILDYRLSDLDIITSRSGWGPDDYVFSFKAGKNRRNHGHLDAGAIALAYGGEWLLTAPRYGHGKTDNTGGYWDYNERRWTYFSPSTEGETTLLINGKNQRFDKEAYSKTDTFITQDDWCWMSVNMDEAYNDVKRIHRNVLHRRGDYLLVFDEVIADEPVTIEWLAQVLASGTAEGDRIQVDGEDGSLVVQALIPRDAVFSHREHTVAHYDVPEDRLKTFAYKVEGSEEYFVTVLLPHAKGEQNPVQSIQTNTAKDGTQTIIVQGNGWIDTITYGNGTVHAQRADANGKAEDALTVALK
ncbi:MAG: DUF4962 domain-containing protein [Puniceicoccales bacterium]